MCAEPVLVFLFVEFAKRQPFQIQCDDSLFRKVNTAFLFVLDRFPRRSHMTVDIQDGWNLALEPLRFIEDRSRLKSWHDLIAQLAHAVSGATLNDSQIL